MGPPYGKYNMKGDSNDGYMDVSTIHEQEYKEENPTEK
jgi:hypothetical protein